MTLQELWHVLETEDVTGEGAGYFSRRVCAESGFDVHIAVEKPSNRRLLLFRVKTLSVDTSTKLPTCKGFELHRASLPGDASGYSTLQLGLTESRFRDVFTVLAQDVLDRTMVGRSEREAVSLFIARLQQWQAFFKRHSPDGLDEEAQRGLYGELWFLRLLLRQGLLDCRQLSGWTGPVGGHQDFEFGGTAVEVKVTSGQQDQRLQISSERQLDSTGIESLFIMHQSLDVRVGSGETLNAIIADIRSMLEVNPSSREQFETLLFAAGYLDGHAGLYGRVGYTHREINYFAVRDDFPRIVESDLKAGVGNVRYAVSVSQCRQYSVEENVVTLACRKHYE